MAVTVRLYMPQANSLKDKRQVVRSLVDTIRARTRAAVAETGLQDLRQQAEIGIALVGADAAALAGPAALIRKLVDQCWDAEIELYDVQYWQPGADGS